MGNENGNLNHVKNVKKNNKDVIDKNKSFDENLLRNHKKSSIIEKDNNLKNNKILNKPQKKPREKIKIIAKDKEENKQKLTFSENNIIINNKQDAKKEKNELLKYKESKEKFNKENYKKNGNEDKNNPEEKNFNYNYKKDKSSAITLLEYKEKGKKIFTKDENKIESNEEKKIKENKIETYEKDIISQKNNHNNSSVSSNSQFSKKIKSNLDNKTYSVKYEPIIKEIMPKDDSEYHIINEKLEKLQNEIKIYDKIEDNKKIYIVIDKENDLKLKNILNQNEIKEKKEKIIIGQGNPIKKSEINELFKLENSVCTIHYERFDENNKIEKGVGSGFFCNLKINFPDFPLKYCLFTNNHVLNDSNLKIGQIINLNYLKDNKMFKNKIQITEKRKVFTHENLDYTCIELFESDNIDNFLEIDPNIYNYTKESLNNINLYILHYFENEISFSYGNIIGIIEDEEKVRIMHNASTLPGSSGSPIIRRGTNSYVIGLHVGSKEKKKYNLGTPFDLILNNIKKKEESFKCNNYIICKYTKKDNEKEFVILHNLNDDWDEVDKQSYNEAKKNIKLFEDNIDLYIDRQKMKFNFTYQSDKNEINVKLVFKTKLTNLSYMFLNCHTLKSIDLSLFDTSNANNMAHMFAGCSSLESLDLSSFNTTNVKSMSGMFSGCLSLKSINLSSFDTSNVNDMSLMFLGCFSLKSLDLSSFTTNNVKNMKLMFSSCLQLESIDLSKFNTINTSNMGGMFFLCNSLKTDMIKSVDAKILFLLMEADKLFKKK